MNHDYAQRRRVALAIAITVIAAPAALLLNRGGTDGAAAPGVTVVGTLPRGASAAPQPPATVDPMVTNPLGTAPVGYLSGSTVPGSDEPPRIAIPRLREAIKGTASFSSAIDSTLRCQVRGVPFNAAVTVTNLDNSRSVRCVASVGGPEPTVDVILATDTFAEIADLTDAPVPVQITWVAP